MTLKVGVDVGTSGVRTAVLDAAGALVSMARAPHPPQDAGRIDATLWWKAVDACLSTQMAKLRDLGRDPAEITGIAVDGTSGSMVLTDAALKPVSPALMYNSKGFTAEAEKIARHAPDPHITRGSNSALGRAMRLVSEARAEPAHLLHQADYIAAKLMGHGGHSDHNNALKTGYDPATGTWPEWISDVIDPALLPRVHAVGSRLGRIETGLARRLGLSGDVTVHAGTTDSIAAFLACAPLEAGMAVTSLGSTLAVKMLSTRRIDDPGIGLYSHRIGDLWLVGGASNTGGAVLLAHFSPEDMDALSARIDPERASGLDYYPLNAPGERFPINDPDLPPRLTPRPRDDARFLQGMYEGIARIEALCYRSIAERGGDRPSRIFSAGGGASSDTFTRIRARFLEQEPVRPRHTEAAIGVANAIC